jgi:hypothetical protein
MRRFARTFPFSKPRAHLWQGLYHWLNGRPRRAHKAWQAAIVEAERLNMPYERGLAHYQIGRHLYADDPARQEHLIHAEGVFTQLETAYDLERVQDALKEA